MTKADGLKFVFSLPASWMWQCRRPSLQVTTLPMRLV